MTTTKKKAGKKTVTATRQRDAPDPKLIIDGPRTRRPTARAAAPQAKVQISEAETPPPDSIPSPPQAHTLLEEEKVSDCDFNEGESDISTHTHAEDLSMSSADSTSDQRVPPPKKTIHKTSAASKKPMSKVRDLQKEAETQALLKGKSFVF